MEGVDHGPFLMFKVVHDHFLLFRIHDPIFANKGMVIFAQLQITVMCAAGG